MQALWRHGASSVATPGGLRHGEADGGGGDDGVRAASRSSATQEIAPRVFVVGQIVRAIDQQRVRVVEQSAMRWPTSRSSFRRRRGRRACLRARCAPAAPAGTRAVGAGPHVLLQRRGRGAVGAAQNGAGPRPAARAAVQSPRHNWRAQSRRRTTTCSRASAARAGARRRRGRRARGRRRRRRRASRSCRARRWRRTGAAPLAARDRARPAAAEEEDGGREAQGPRRARGEGEGAVDDVAQSSSSRSSGSTRT